MANIIEVSELRKVFSNGVVAVDNVSFTVAEGEIFGFLGPNGAGKSTTISILTTLLAPTGGTARVAGCDVTRHPMQVRLHIGYVSQDLAVDDNLTGYGNLRLQAIAMVNPLTYAVTPMRIAATQGWLWSQMWVGVLVLGIMAALSVTLAITQFNRTIG